MGDKTLDALITLRQYYESKKDSQNDKLNKFSKLA